MGLHEIKKLLQNKGVGENIGWLYIRQRTDNQNIHGAQKTKLPQINEPIKKWATKQNFFKGRNPVAQNI
jgi:hypothetical protein